MVYLLLVIGLVLIYFSLRYDKPSDRGKNFSTVLQNNINTMELEEVIEELNDFSDRIENIEASLLLIEEKLHYNNVVNSTIDINDKINFPESNNEEQETILNNEQLNFIETNSQVDEIKTLNDTLYQLHDEGKTVDEISSITRIGKGEILLRLGLRKQR